jgi:hypothetical protein
MEQLPVTQVRLGISPEQKYHFLGIMLSRELESREITEVCERLRAHFTQDDGPFMLPQFVGKEIHLLPSPKSEKLFETMKLALQEYQMILETFGLMKWIGEIDLNGFPAKHKYNTSPSSK